MAGEGFDDAFHRCTVLRRSCKGAVEIDHMKVARASFGEYCRLRRRIVTVNGSTVHVAFGKAHDLARFEVDGGKYDHGFHSRKRVRRPSPKLWLFSG